MQNGAAKNATVAIASVPHSFNTVALFDATTKAKELGHTLGEFVANRKEGSPPEETVFVAACRCCLCQVIVLNDRYFGVATEFTCDPESRIKDLVFPREPMSEEHQKRLMEKMPKAPAKKG